jgi:hypothetical protein
LARAAGQLASEAVDPNRVITQKEQRHHAEQHVDRAPPAGHDLPGFYGTRLEIRR